MNSFQTFAIVLLVALAAAASNVNALERGNLFMDVPFDLAPSLYRYLDTQPIFDATDGKVRFVPRVSGIGRASFLARLSEKQRQSFHFVHISPPYQPDHGGPAEALCECSLLSESEFVVSEMPLISGEGVYVSINDESYKAILELIRYPFTDIELASVALSELAYVYNSDALRIFLKEKGFELVQDAGFMNSQDYPGYRDSQYLVTLGIGEVFVVVRGTSGALDIETTLDAELIPFGDLGLVHRGYHDIARHIRADVFPVIKDIDKPVVITGHSIGGSVSLMLSLMLMKDGLSVRNLNFAPVPMVDYRVNSVFGRAGNIVNYFLPNEELGSLEDRGEWLYLPGQRAFMDDVGTTAGAAHFVINYLKSMLVKKGLSKEAYEVDIPDCVVIKYSCFDGNELNFVSACAFNENRCMEREFNLLIGYDESSLTNSNERDSILEVLISRASRQLLVSQSTHVSKALTYRLVYLLIERGQTRAASALFNTLERDGTAEGFGGFLQRSLSELSLKQ